MIRLAGFVRSDEEEVLPAEGRDAERVLYARRCPDAAERLRWLRDMFEFYRYLLLGRR